MLNLLFCSVLTQQRSLLLTLLPFGSARFCIAFLHAVAFWQSSLLHSILAHCCLWQRSLLYSVLVRGRYMAALAFVSLWRHGCSGPFTDTRPSVDGPEHGT